MSRLPRVAFAGLVLATIGAFFVAQHLKVTTPLIAGSPRPFPAVINPNETGCYGENRVAQFSFYLLHRTDDVAVYVVDSNGNIIRTLASGRHMRRGVRFPDGNFPWDGREDDGRIAPDGTYYMRIALLHQGRTIELTKNPVSVDTAPPRPKVTAVAPSLVPQGGGPITIHYSGVQKRGATVMLYRTDLPGAPRLVKSFGAPSGTSTTWDGTVRRRPAPAGTYLVGLKTTDAACNTGHFPASIPPLPGTTPGAGVTVRYLAVQPPLTPQPAGSATVAYVDSRGRPYKWTLTRIGARKAAARGSDRSFALHLRVPSQGAGLYVLSVTSGAHRTTVPLIASAGGGRRPRMLVVLPALTWQGQNPVDDDGDGLPNTLDGREPVLLARPLADGLPSDFADEAALLASLDRSRLPYDLTTDLGLIQASGPQLASYAGVVLAGTERWVPTTFGASLRSYVQGGGHLVSLGVGSLLRAVTIRSGRASAPTAPSSTDPLGAHPGTLATHNKQLLLVIRDGLGIFSSTSGTFSGYSSYQPLSVSPPAQPISSAAGVSSTSPAIIGYRLGKGSVVDVGLPGFASTLARNVDAQELIRRLWTVLSR
jgi:FlgD Ig-like domain